MLKLFLSEDYNGRSFTIVQDDELFLYLWITTYFRLIHHIAKSFSCLYDTFSKFLSEGTDMYVDGSGEHIRIELSPDFFEEFLAIDRNSPILGQVLEEIELFCREFYDLGISRDQTFRRVYLQIADMNQSCLIGDISPSERFYSGNKLIEIKRFPEIIIGSDIESCDDIFCGIPGGEEKYGSVVSLFSEFLAESQSVFPREVYVQDDHIKMLSDCPFFPYNPVKCHFCLKRLESQVFPDILREYSIVFYDEDFHSISGLVRP